jgi:cysteine desulfurase family protein
MAGDRPIRYFDHAATSWPKPPEVVDAIVRAMAEAGGNPGRGAHPLSLAAARTIAGARSAIASLLGVPDDRDIIFAAGCTAALNLVLKGSLVSGDRVVVSSVEHNAVVRPLIMLAASGVEVSVVQADAEGRVDPDDVERAVRERPTRAVVCQHASNVTGAIQSIGDLADIAHEHGAVMIVDGAQGAGHLALDLVALGADAYAASGHKAMLGPQGIGFLYLSSAFQPAELVHGGGGGDSGASEQPSARPDRYEAGTGNTPGAAGLGAAAGFLAARGDEIRTLEQRLARRLHEGLLETDGIRVLGPPPAEERVPVVSMTHERLAPDEIAFALDRRAGIAVRAGLHCSPWTHQTVGTADSGAVRFGLGWGLTDDDVDAALEAVRDICA